MGVVVAMRAEGVSPTQPEMPPFGGAHRTKLRQDGGEPRVAAGAPHQMTKKPVKLKTLFDSLVRFLAH